VSRPSILGPPPAKNDVRPLKTPLQKVPTALIEERRKKGLCFYCEEKWHNGHKCKSPKVYLFMERLQSQGLEANLNVGLEEESVGKNAQLELQLEVIEQSVEITLYALLGSPSLGTMRVLGRINHQEMIILIDIGSIHNFLDTLMWMLLKLPLSIQDNFDVKIASGAVLKTKGACHEVGIKIQGKEFLMELNVQSLGGCDVVLGTQWLFTHGLIQWDFQKLTMEFNYQGNPILIKGL